MSTKMRNYKSLSRLDKILANYLNRIRIEPWRHYATTTNLIPLYIIALALRWTLLRSRNYNRVYEQINPKYPCSNFITQSFLLYMQSKETE